MNADITVERVEALRLPLVNRFYKQCRYSAKAGRGEVVYVATAGGNIVAAVRLTPVRQTPGQEGYYFLRSMCVAPEMRGQGIGRQLLLGMQSFLDSIDCYCYPFSHLLDFYAAAGFCHIDDDKAEHWMREPFLRYCRQGRDIKIMVRKNRQGEV
jgi:predicted N-acetyltransferase YhbS